MTIVVEPREDAAAAVASIRRALREADRVLAAADVTTLSSLVRQANALPRLQAILFVGFGIIAIGIVALRSYGVMSQLVATRQGELTVRLAFGATPRRLGLSVLAQAGVIAVPGILLGVLLTRPVEAGLRPLVFGVAADSAAIGGVVGVATLVVVALATLPPAAQSDAAEPDAGTRRGSVTTPDPSAPCPRRAESGGVRFGAESADGRLRARTARSARSRRPSGHRS